MKRRLLLVTTLAFVAAAGPSRAQTPAEPFPARLVKVVVAWPAGGFVDAITRAVQRSRYRPCRGRSTPFL